MLTILNQKTLMSMQRGSFRKEAVLNLEIGRKNQVVREEKVKALDKRTGMERVVKRAKLAK